MTQNAGERQVATKIEDVRRDHVARYEWAAKRLPAGSAVIDFACGVGYGCRILADAGHTVTGLDIDAEAIAHAEATFSGARTTFALRDAADPGDLGSFDAATCFETIEHVEDPRALLLALRKAAPVLLASVPNEDVIPFGDGFPFHHRHYRRTQFRKLLAECGWKVHGWFGQSDDASEVEPSVNGRTLVVWCEHGEFVPDDGEGRAPIRVTNSGPSGVSPFDHLADPPEHVAILGLGPSLDQYLDVCKRLGGKHAFCDETWGINALGAVLYCDRVFHMDDIRVQESRADAQPASNIARMVEWLRHHPGPVITSRAHPEYPGLVEFPLQDVLQKFEVGYFNSTAAYSIAYAMHIGVKRVSLFGMDFTYPNQHDAEKGRGCVEFWIGMAMARGIKVAVSQRSSLLDAVASQAERFYGYDTVDVVLSTDDGRAKVEYIDKVAPSADEIEERYDHSRHPNLLVESER